MATVTRRFSSVENQSLAAAASILTVIELQGARFMTTWARLTGTNVTADLGHWVQLNPPNNDAAALALGSFTPVRGGSTAAWGASDVYNFAQYDVSGLSRCTVVNRNNNAGSLNTWQHVWLYW